MSSGKCKYSDDCDENTVSQTREEVGSSFKPYVLSTAVQEGMDVQDSILNSSEYICVAPDRVPRPTPRRFRSGCTTSRA